MKQGEFGAIGAPDFRTLVRLIQKKYEAELSKSLERKTVLEVFVRSDTSQWGEGDWDLFLETARKAYEDVENQ